MAGEIFQRDLIVYNPLSEVTRKERTALLGTSMLGVALVKVPLVPEKFSALGIDFTSVNQATFVGLYAVVVSYYLIAFLLYAVTDFIAWLRQETITLSEYTREERERARVEVDAGSVADVIERQRLHELRPRPQTASHNCAYSGPRSYWLAKRAAQIRATFEFGAPLVFALYSIFQLARFAAA